MAIRTRLSRWLSGGALLAAGALVVTGCASSAPSSGGSTAPTELVEPTEPITITYTGAAQSAEQVAPVIAEFEAQHPMITVNYEAIPVNDFNSVLAARITNANDAIDVFDVDMPRTDAYAARGWLMDLTPTFPEVADAVDPESLEAATVDGKLVAVPWITSTSLLYYNKDLLTAAGLELPSADAADRLTWEQLVDDAKVAQAAGAKNGILFDQLNRYFQFYPLTVGLGGGLGAGGEGNLTPDIENEGWLEAATWYANLYNDGISPRGLTAAETSDTFASGNTAFYVGGPWWPPKFVGETSLNFGVAPMPAFEAGEAVTTTGAWSLGVNPQSSADRQNASLIFIKFLALDDGGATQYIDSKLVLPSNDEGRDRWAESEVLKDPRMAGFVDLVNDERANTAVVRLKTVGYVEFEAIMIETLDNIISGQDPKEALENATAKLDSAWAKYR